MRQTALQSYIFSYHYHSFSYLESKVVYLNFMTSIALFAFVTIFVLKLGYPPAERQSGAKSINYALFVIRKFREIVWFSFLTKLLSHLNRKRLKQTALQSYTFSYHYHYHSLSYLESKVVYLNFMTSIALFAFVTIFVLELTYPPAERQSGAKSIN